MIAAKTRTLRCAVYTRKSSEEGLDQSFNSLDAQREACEAYIKSQAHEGWTLVKKHYDDGGFSGGTMERPGLQSLLADIDHGLVDVVVVYKVDRLTRSLADFAKIVEVLDDKGASFDSVTQQFNTTTSMGRLTLNVLLSFAQFEREVTGERIRDKVAASKKKGMWMGGFPPMGYDILNRKLAVNDAEAKILRSIFERFLELGSVRALVADLRRRKIVSKRWKTRKGHFRGGHSFCRGALYYLLRNRIYLGEVEHKDHIHRGEHPPILSRDLWARVQAQLDERSRADRTVPRSRGDHLLTGLIFDDRGNRMSPSHVKKKNGQRYRYYLSQALLQHRPDRAGSLPRIAATVIEELVVDRVACLTGVPADSKRGSRPDEVVHNASVKTLVRRAEIGSKRVILSIDRASLGIGIDRARHRLREADTIEEVGDTFRVTVPIRLKAWGGETVIEGPNGVAATVAAHIDRNLVKAIARASEWRAALATGKAKSFRAIARQAGCTEGYVRQIVDLAFLAPDVVSAILRGTQARHLTVDRLVRRPLPLSWRNQRRVLGLAG